MKISSREKIPAQKCSIFARGIICYHFQILSTNFALNAPTFCSTRVQKQIKIEHLKIKKDDLSLESIRLIEERGVLQGLGNTEQVNRTTKLIRRQRKKDKRKAATEALNKDIDQRDRWLGLRQLKKGFQTNPYAIKDNDGNRALKNQIAEAIATHLEENTWKNSEATESK